MNLEQIVRDLKGSVDLSFDRKREAQYFYMDTKYIHFGLDGRRLATESYLLKIQYAPKPENVEEYTCSELQLQIDDGPSVIVPELNNWACVFNPMLSGSDQRPLWGIPQDKFVNLCDSEGKALLSLSVMPSTIASSTFIASTTRLEDR